MKDEKTIREEFEKFIKTLPKRVGETPEKVITDWWVALRRKENEEMRDKIESLPNYYGNPKEEKMVYLSDFSKLLE